MDILKQYVDMRFRFWSNPEGTIFKIYESCPEDGPGVTKCLQSFYDEKERAEEWLTQHKQAYLEWLKKFVRITVSMQPSSPAPSALSTTSSLRRALNPRKPSSERKSKQAAPESEQATGSSSATSPGSVTRSRKRQSIPADEVDVGMTMIYASKRHIVQVASIEGERMKITTESGIYEFGLDEAVTVEVEVEDIPF